MKKLFITLFCIFSLGTTIWANGDDAPKHHFGPYMGFTKKKSPTDTNKIGSFGMAYKYDQPEGYNTKIYMSLMSAGSHNPNMQFEFQNSYKMKVDNLLSFYPFITLKSHVYGNGKYNNEKYRVTQGTSAVIGVGFLKDLNDNLTVSLQTGFSRHLSHTAMIKDKEKFYTGMDIPKLNGFNTHVSLLYKLSDKNYLEIEPNYHKIFKAGHSEKGSKAAMHWIF